MSFGLALARASSAAISAAVSREGGDGEAEVDQGKKEAVRRRDGRIGRMRRSDLDCLRGTVLSLSLRQANPSLNM